MATGVVKFYKAERGRGAISSPELPEGLDASVHFSAIEAEGYRAFEQGDRGEFDYVPVRQDGFRYLATCARRP